MSKPRFEPMVLEIDDLCDALSIGKNTAYDLLNSGEIDCFKIGSTWKISRVGLENYIQRQCETRKKEMCVIVDKKN